MKKILIMGAGGCGKSLSTWRHAQLEELRAWQRDLLEATARWMDAAVDDIATRPRFAVSRGLKLQEVFQESVHLTQCVRLEGTLRSAHQTDGITNLKDRLHRIREMLAFLHALIRSEQKLLRRAIFAKPVFLHFEEFFFTHGEPRPPQVNASNGMRWPVVA